MLFSPVYKESDSRPLALSLEVFTLLALSFEGSLEGLLFSPLRPVAIFPNPLNLQTFQHSNAVLPVSCPPRPHHLPLSPFDFSALPKPFRINTCELVYRCGKQRTYGKAKFIRINTYKNHRGRGLLWLTGLIGRLSFRQGSRTVRHTPQLSRRDWPRGFAHDKLRLDGNLRDVFSSPFDLIDDRLRRNLPHPDQRLSNRGKAWVGIRRSRNVIESNHRDIFRHAQTCFLDRPDRTDGRYIVVSKKRGERLLPRQQLFREWVSNPWCRIGSFQLNGQLGPDKNVQFLGDF